MCRKDCIYQKYEYCRFGGLKKEESRKKEIVTYVIKKEGIGTGVICGKTGG